MSMPEQADTLSQFVQEHAQRNTGKRWQLENPKALEINLNNEQVIMKAGCMVGYYGNVKFSRTSGGGGIGGFLKRQVSGESNTLMRAEGLGTVYVADQGKEVCLINLKNESITLNGSDMLAYESGIQWDITWTRGAGMSAGGLFQLVLQGSGLVAFTTHGKPLVLGVTPERPLYTDPNATVAWSSNLHPSYRTDMNLQTLIGRSSGETFQLLFHGQGFVVVQPYEELPPSTQSSSGNQGGLSVGRLMKELGQ